MADYIFHDHMKDLDAAGKPYGKSDMTFSKLISRFNLSRLPDYDNATEPYISYIFFSRPSINLSSNNISSMRSHTKTSALINDAQGYELMRSLSDSSNNVWLPLLTTRAMSYSVSDVNMRTVDKISTYYGHTIKYGVFSEEHKIGRTFSIDFRNDRFLSVLKLCHLWSTYYSEVSKTAAFVPLEAYQKNAILDYPGSIYYLVTKRNGRELVYWEKWTGIFPLNVPFNIFSSNDNFILEDRFSIEFYGSIRSDPYDPSVLMDINFLSGLSSSAIETQSKNGVSNEVFQNSTTLPFVR